MHKNIAIAAVMAALLVGSVAPALAQGKPSTVPGQGSSRREEAKERMQEKREEMKERLSNARQERIKSWFKRMQKRLTMLIDRQYRLADKIQVRLDRAAENGKDVTSLRADLAAARTKIDTAKQALTGMAGQIDSILEDNSPREAFAKLHELQKDVFNKIREAHRALVKVIASLRGIGGATTPSVTPSPTSSPTATPTP
jgi:DNA repair exonuclease SbcCD ATPase subunit